MERRKNISLNTRMLLVARSAGFCEFESCNRFLYDDVLRSGTNTGQKAHIRAISPNGPRGYGDSKTDSDINNVENLMLLCPEHHKLIDSEEGTFTVEILQKMKQKHEDLVRKVKALKDTGLCNVMTYFTPIDDTLRGYAENELVKVLFNDGLYTNEHFYRLNAENTEDRDCNPKDSETLAEAMDKKFDRDPALRELLEHPTNQLVLFGLGAAPLLIKLGTMFPMAAKLVVYQKLRVPSCGKDWGWNASRENIVTEYRLREPDHAPIGDHIPVLALFATDTCSDEEITRAFPEESSGDLDIWKLQSDHIGYDILGNQKSLDNWSRGLLETMNKMRKIYGQKPIRVFPIVNNALAIMTGRAKVGKTDSKWILYDRFEGGFKKTITI